MLQLTLSGKLLDAIELRLPSESNQIWASSFRKSTLFNIACFSDHSNSICWPLMAFSNSPLSEERANQRSFRTSSAVHSSLLKKCVPFEWQLIRIDSREVEICTQVHTFSRRMRLVLRPCSYSHLWNQMCIHWWFCMACPSKLCSESFFLVIPKHRLTVSYVCTHPSAHRTLAKIGFEHTLNPHTTVSSEPWEALK